MRTRHSVLDRVAIPISCDANLSEMHGTERVRHCAICDQNVYDLSAMTRREAEELIEGTGGRLCAKIYRRPDGGILTRNCPPGIRGLSLKLVRRASWMMSAVLGWSPLGAQEAPRILSPGGTLVQIEKTEKEGASGMFYDASGAEVPGATIGVSPVAGGAKAEVRSAKNGRYHMGPLAPGEYVVTIACPGFKSIRKTLTLQSKQTARLDSTLDIADGLLGITVMAQPSEVPLTPVAPVKKAGKKK